MVKRKIILCSESLRLDQQPSRPPEQYSLDAEAIIGLLKNNFEILESGEIEIEAIGFGGKAAFMKEIPKVIRNTFATYRHRVDDTQIFIVAIRDADTSDAEKISNLQERLISKIRKASNPGEFRRVKVVFAVQAIEAWLLADEQTLNNYLGEKNKAKRVNDPETIHKPKEIIHKLFQQSSKKYNAQALLDLLPRVNILTLLRCRHFKQLYDRIKSIVER